jgi:hypothetical protein
MKQRTIFKNKANRPMREVLEKRKFNPSEYRGIYKYLRLELEEEIEKIREEWIRE